MDSRETKDRKRKKKRKLSNKKKVVISIFSVLLVLVLLMVLGYFYVRSKIYRASKPVEKHAVTQNNTNDEKEKTVEYKTVEGITNILFIGDDGVDLDSEEQRSDSILIATLDNNNKKVKITSLYRDALVYIPGYGEDKINAAYFLGGPELLMDTIRYNFDINIEQYVRINFVGFEAVIDKIGGIEVDVQEYQLHELNKYIGESTGGNDCPVEEAGLQMLNGKQALSYSRIRKGVGDDYERTERQREVLFKLAEKLKEINPIKYAGIMYSMLDYIRTNIEPIEALNMAYTIFKFPSLVTEQLSIPVPELCTDDQLNGTYVMRMDAYENAKILNDFIFEDYLPDFILNRSTEKDPSIYYEYDGFGSSYDYDYYYEEDYYDPVVDEPLQEEVIQPETPEEPYVPEVPEEPTDEIIPPVDENNPGGSESTEGDIVPETGNNTQ